MKFHKVGSATVSRTLRCLSYVRPALLPDVWLSPRHVNGSNRALPPSHVGRRAMRCGSSPWEHDVMLLYKLGGAAGIGACVKPGYAPRLITTLRDPFERVMSAIYFFLGGWRAEDDTYRARFGGDAPEPFTSADLADIVARELLEGAGGPYEYLQALSRERTTRWFEECVVDNAPQRARRAGGMRADRGCGVAFSSRPNERWCCSGRRRGVATDRRLDSEE